ncbi:MAG: 4Fe-4S dicluster domain-containing protein [Chloroflexi bacterium]|nr:4Fe-4S dicluster domain-containing protein [Chloroflexota bacterium]
MNTLPQAIQERIAQWLEAGEIEVFIGYERGPVPLRATPAFVRDPKEVGRLIWDATCENNLVAFLPKYRGKKVGILVKGCDSRAINGLIQEGQVQRANLKVIGVHCAGVVDPLQVARRLGVPVEALEQVGLEGELLRANGVTLPVAEVLYDLCKTCAQHNPVVADETIGSEIPDASRDEAFAHVREMEALSSDERWARFTQELERCNLCYACRNACPMCYCNVCFVDRTMPRWFNQTTTAEDIQFYQIMRTFHLAGRCVGCGACTRACPQGVNLRLLLDKLRLECLELFGYEAGINPQVEPPLRTYRQDDYNDFIMSD